MAINLAMGRTYTRHRPPPLLLEPLALTQQPRDARMLRSTLPDELAAKFIAQWLPADETRQMEFKRVSGKMVGKALETVCAFANADGGLLVLGLAELKEFRGPSRRFGIEENGEAVDELERKLRTEFLPPLGGLQLLRLPTRLHNGSTNGQAGHLLVVQVPRSA